MLNDNTQTGVIHPEGKILLLNGNVLDCFPKDELPEIVLPEEVHLDSSGEFFRLGGKAPSRRAVFPGEKDSKEDDSWERLFYKEAFFLYEHKDDVYSDSRMFLTPLPFRNNLAYSGTYGLKDSTLGIYLEWWHECERAVIKVNGEVIALTYFIAGSPLSGANMCSVVDRKGKSHKVVFNSPFSDLWKPFMQVNRRYTEAKQLYKAYSLEETVSLLR